MIRQLDTNICIYLLKGLLRDPLPEADYAISVITRLELLSYPSLGEAEKAILLSFLEELNIIPLDGPVQDLTVTFRRKYGLKLPDAIIAGSAVSRQATLVSNDRGLTKISELNIEAMALKDQPL